nr:hypothetical protein [uncultured Lichenicoccus sp.]
MSIGRRVHGRSQTATWNIWKGMRQRCGNPKSPSFQWYGARGITVCDRWNSFQAFLEDMGERPEGLSIDRIDNERGYEPGNCRWADAEAQANNKRQSDVVGSKNPNARLTEAQAREIKKALKDYYRGQIDDLAAQYRVSANSIYMLKSGRTWRHLL